MVIMDACSVVTHIQVTREELSELGLDHLIGTGMVKAYMHGYFINNKLYQRSKLTMNPTAYEEYQKEKNRKKDKERKERRITLNHKKPEVNAELSARLSGKVCLLCAYDVECSGRSIQCTV
jgi:ribosome biogenesis protein ENP2